MAAVSALCVAFGQWIAAQSTLVWLAIGVGLFVVGWVFQFIGHVAYEHRKPAFVDDVIGLLIGPLFVLAEALFGFGWRPALREASKRAGAVADADQRAAAHSEAQARMVMSPAARVSARSATRRTLCKAVSATAIQIGMYVANCAALSVSPSNVTDTSTSNTGST